MKVHEWVAQATGELEDAGIESARLDAELLLSDNDDVVSIWYDDLPCSREEIVTKADQELREQTVELLKRSVERRMDGEPLAYVIGHKEFYGREFYVNNNVLIPRPETEQLIEIAKKLDPKSVLDVGTGSGCIAATLARELPETQVTASDISLKALDVAVLNNALTHKERFKDHVASNTFSFSVKKSRRNNGVAKRTLHSNGMDFVQSDLLEDVNDKFELIVANLPYVDSSWEVSPETIFEPKRALFAATNGTSLMRRLIRQAPKNLVERGHLLLEMDTRQLDIMANYAHKHGFAEIERHPFALLLQRVD
ncbi:peptide chain release factor N(5)-glutamine methyltransferase [Candidatus Saccharibacteria bacterium]|jgi:release factor glutamine methyltransferase|nr:peptide chain release factor N(5)-glutamine methyltransferase [Candidatus Saccharibacteria bacterium]